MAPSAKALCPVGPPAEPHFLTYFAAATGGHGDLDTYNYNTSMYLLTRKITRRNPWKKFQSRVAPIGGRERTAPVTTAFVQKIAEGGKTLYNELESKRNHEKK